MNPIIYVGIDNLQAKVLQNGETIDYPHSIDQYIFGGKLDRSNWPDLWQIHEKERIPGYVDFSVGVLIGSLHPSLIMNRVRRRFLGQFAFLGEIIESYREVSFVLTAEETAETYALDRRKLESRLATDQERVYDQQTAECSGLTSAQNPLPCPNPFVLNYFRSARPISEVIAENNDFSKFDIIIPCGQIDPKRISWRLI